MMTGVPANAGSDFSRSVKRNPSISGMCASARTTWKGTAACWALRIASHAPPAPDSAEGAVFQAVSICWRIRRVVAQSLTRRTRKPRGKVDSSASGGAAWLAARQKRAVKWNLLPQPTSLSSHTRPPIKETSRETMVRPKPVPP